MKQIINRMELRFPSGSVVVKLAAHGGRHRTAF